MGLSPDFQQLFALIISYIIKLEDSKSQGIVLYGGIEIKG